MVAVVVIGCLLLAGCWLPIVVSAVVVVVAVAVVVIVMVAVESDPMGPLLSMPLVAAQNAVPNVLPETDGTVILQ